MKKLENSQEQKYVVVDVATVWNENDLLQGLEQDSYEVVPTLKKIQTDPYKSNVGIVFMLRKGEDDFIGKKKIIEKTFGSNQIVVSGVTNAKQAMEFVEKNEDDRSGSLRENIAFILGAEPEKEIKDMEIPRKGHIVGARIFNFVTAGIGKNNQRISKFTTQREFGFL